MESVLRLAVVYVFLMLLFRIGGRRTVANMSRFDLVVVLLISELLQQAMTGSDPSLTQAIVLCAALVALDLVFSWVKMRWPRMDHLIEGIPVLLVERGRPLHAVMREMRVDEADVLEAARRIHGLRDLGQVQFAVLETNGSISIIPEASDPRRGS
jgi:uncharacterized membrane protein YcaP (DUF421 family)